MKTAALKTINYRGGIVRFRIPTDWAEEYEDTGGGTFYKYGDDTGTLRLNVLTFRAPPDKPVSAQTAAEILVSESRKHRVPVVPLRGGAAMIRLDAPAEENGQQLMIRYWRIAQALPPVDIRLAIFSYTLLAEQFRDPAFAAELDLLDRELSAAELAPVLGETPTAHSPG